jgi:hypothetical protein
MHDPAGRRSSRSGGARPRPPPPDPDLGHPLTLSLPAGGIAAAAAGGGASSSMGPGPGGASMVGVNGTESNGRSVGSEFRRRCREARVGGSRLLAWLRLRAGWLSALGGLGNGDGGGLGWGSSAFDRSARPCDATARRGLAPRRAALGFGQLGTAAAAWLCDKCAADCRVLLSETDSTLAATVSRFLSPRTISDSESLVLVIRRC